MTLRFGFSTEGDSAQKTAIARQVIAAAAEKAVSIFNGLASGWASLSGASSEGSPKVELDG